MNNKHEEWVKEGFHPKEEFDPEKTNAIIESVKGMLPHLDLDPHREGLKETPMRVAKSFQFLTYGQHEDPIAILQKSKFKEDYNHMLLVRDIELHSLCEHHLLPFYGKAHVAYIPNGHITGLSTIARVVEIFSRRLQVQERLTVQIRDCIQEALDPLGVAVVIEARHMCMIMRGVQKQNSVVATSAFTGAFLKNPKTREEFINLINREGANF